MRLCTPPAHRRHTAKDTADSTLTARPEHEAIAAARAVAWLSHINTGGPGYAIRGAAWARLRAALAHPPRRGSIEQAFVLRAARVVAGCSPANRWGLPYYARKDAMARLRGCIAVMDDIDHHNVDVLARHAAHSIATLSRAEFVARDAAARARRIS